MKRNYLAPTTELTIIKRTPETYRVVHNGELVGKIIKIGWGLGWGFRSYQIGLNLHAYPTKASALSALIATLEKPETAALDENR